MITRRKIALALVALALTASPALARMKPPKPPVRRACPTCHGTGQIVISGGQSRKCPRCNGKGFI